MNAPLPHHDGAAGLHLLEQPDSQVLGRPCDIHVIGITTTDIVIGRIVHHAPAPEFPVRFFRYRDIHPCRGPLPNAEDEAVTSTLFRPIAKPFLFLKRKR